MNVEIEVRGPWSLAISARFWEGFTPLANPGATAEVISMDFCADADWQPVHADVRQVGARAQLAITGPGDLAAAADQVARILALDVDASGWPAVGRRDRIIGALQQQVPGLRPTGFHSPYEAAAWSVLSQRVRIGQAAAVRRRITAEFGSAGAFPPPTVLAAIAPGLDLPGRKGEYLHAVAEAALDGQLAGGRLRAMTVEDAIADVRQILGLGPFAAQLVVLRGANHPDGQASGEPRLLAEIARRYGEDADAATVIAGWAPFRTWGAVYLRAAGD